jgi:hypothetical protein
MHIGTVMATTQRTAEQDGQALIALENTWLKGEHDAAVLDSIPCIGFHSSRRDGRFPD